MRKPALRCAVLVAAVSIACKSSDSTAPATNLAGKYKLVKVDSLALPAGATLLGTSRTVTSGSLIIDDSTFHDTLCVTLPNGVPNGCGAGQQAVADAGLVWSTSQGSSFLGQTSHVSRGLVVRGDSVIFQQSDFATPILTFVRQ